MENMSDILSDIRDEYEATISHINKLEKQKEFIEGRLEEANDKRVMLFGLMDKWQQ